MSDSRTLPSKTLVDVVNRILESAEPHPSGANVVIVRRHLIGELREALQHAPETFPQSFHEGMRQSYLKALELSGASGMLGDGDKSDLLEMYRRLWPRAPSDIRENALKANSIPGAGCGCSMPYCKICNPENGDVRHD